MDTKRSISVLICLLTFVTGVQAVDSDVAGSSLLHGRDVQIVAQSDSQMSRQNLRVLHDGQAGRSVDFKLEPGIPLDVTWRLPATATCDELIVTTDARRLSAKQLPRIEVLVSTLSARSGFQTVRSFVLQATDQPQTLKLPGSAAQWVLVRLTTPAETTQLAVSEIDIRGRPGPPKSRYGFKEAPAKVFSVLAEVEKSVTVTITDDEQSLYRDAADGTLNDWSFAEAALVSGGIQDAEQRQKLLKQIDGLTVSANTIIKNEQTPYARAERLLEWLHENAMAAGYEEHQTDLATILKTGKFNCVSSATLYNIIGRRLDLDLRAIEVPDHAFSILYVGSKHADVETTNALGFNPARDPRVLKRFQMQTGFHYIPDRHADKRREISDTGLLALTCYNHGVSHSQEKEYPEALADYFRALSLDPELTSAIQNVLSVFANWSRELAEDGQFEQAVGIVSTGLRLAPDDRTLLHNRKVAWQQWALAEIAGNRRESALAVLRNAARVAPQDGFDRMQAYVFIQPGEKLVGTRKWTEALSLAAEGLKVVTETAGKELRGWRRSVYHRWTSAALDQKDFQAAADVLTQALQIEPEDRKFSGNTAYVMQEWLIETHKTKGLPAAETLLKDLARRFNKVDSTRRVIESFIGRITETLIADEKPDAALALVGRTDEWLSEGTARDLRRMVFDRQAAMLIRLKQWEKAVVVYTGGLKTLPGDSHLRNNLLAVWDMWAGTFRGKRDWSGAADIYARALDSGINDNTFSRKIGYCVQELALTTWKSDGPEAAEKQIAAWQKKRPAVRDIGRATTLYVQTLVRHHQKSGEHVQALRAVDRCRSLIDKPGHQQLVRSVCDTWARTHSRKKKWMQTIAVYTTGLKSLPADSHLTRNAVATWNTQAGIYIDRREWAEAIKVYEQALDQFPGDGTLKNNLKYCRQQAEKQKAT